MEVQVVYSNLCKVIELIKRTAVVVMKTIWTVLFLQNSSYIKLQRSAIVFFRRSYHQMFLTWWRAYVVQGKSPPSLNAFIFAGGQLTCEQPVHLKCKRSKFLRGNRFDKATLGVSQKFSMFLFLLLLIFYLFMFSFYSVYFWDIFLSKRKRRNRMLTPHCKLVPMTITVSVLIIY